MDQPLVRNASNEKQIKEADRKLLDSRLRELNDIRAILSTREGRRFFWRQLALCDRSSANNSGSWTYFYEGERNFALKLKADIIEASPEGFLEMQNEMILKGELKNV